MRSILKPKLRSELGLRYWGYEQQQRSVLIFVTFRPCMIIDTSKTFLGSYSNLRKDSHLNIEKFSSRMMNTRRKLEK